MDSSELTVATWNTMWASGAGARAVRVLRRLREVDADPLVVTEGQRDRLPDGGHVFVSCHRDHNRVFRWCG
ncbi:hypothetical protein ACWDTG_15900 [Rhodococcus zopfii]|uniref:hypothetical protein n=1 Tax=Rhodococcus zopfii TaxID=43772 RepID=UPI0019810AC7|nr:hypothetical protein [Rhodococcus zopfii]